MTIAEKIELDGGYVVEIHYDEDAFNPLKEFDGQPTLVLHRKAEGHFGWTNDDEWFERINSALDRVAERGYTRNLRGPRGALEVVNRWLRAFHGVRVVLPVGAGEHSGTWVYLGDTEHWCDPGGWDSGWIGWLFALPEQTREWYGGEPTDEQVAKGLEGSFKEFSDWVSGSCYGYVVTHEDGHDIDDDSCWGFYGSESYDEGGYMREQFMEVVERDRAERGSDESEIADLATAEIGASL